MRTPTALKFDLKNLRGNGYLDGGKHTLDNCTRVSSLLWHHNKNYDDRVFYTRKTAHEGRYIVGIYVEFNDHEYNQ